MRLFAAELENKYLTILQQPEFHISHRQPHDTGNPKAERGQEETIHQVR